MPGIQIVSQLRLCLKIVPDPLLHETLEPVGSKGSERKLLGSLESPAINKRIDLVDFEQGRTYPEAKSH